MERQDRSSGPGLIPFIGNITCFPARGLARLFRRTGFPVYVVILTTILLFLLSTGLAITTGPVLFIAGSVFYVACLVTISAELYIQAGDKRINTNIILCRISRYTGYTLFFSACGIRAYLESRSGTYLASVSFMAFVWVYFALLMIRFTSSDTPHLQALLTPGNLQNLQMSSKYRWERWLLSVHPLAAPEVLPLIVVLLCIFNRPGIPFWSSSVFLLGSIYVILRLLVYLDTDHARAMRQSVLSFLFYLIGATILLVLVMRLPLSDIREVISLVGPEAVWLIFFPAVWAVPYAMTLTVLLDNRISFRDALYTQVSGDGFNGITPLLGMGGEPYKARHLSRFVPLQDSSRAIVQSRLIHALSGVLYTVIILLICLLIVDLSRLPALKAALLIITLVMILVTTFILWVTMSRAPSHFTGYVLSKFRLIEEFRHDPLSWSKLSLATLYRLIGRFGRFLELYLIFLVLEIVPSFADVVIVQGMVMASVSIFFFVPQGLGVNEAGIVTALDIAGYSAATGVVFGLIRRARMIVYTLMGLIVYVIGTALYARKKP